MQASAVAYFTNGRVILAPMSRTTAGVFIASDPQTYGRSAKKAVIARALVHALAASRDDVAHPTPDQWKRQFIPFQDAAGVKNFKTFMRDAKSVDIDRDNDRVTLTPSVNLGPKNGFEAVEAEAITLPADDADGLAATLLTLLGLRPPADR